jgi:hypothetical protein
MSDTCETCRFFRWTTLHNKKYATGDCLRHAPVVFPNANAVPITVWPTTWNGDSCGDWQCIPAPNQNITFTQTEPSL